MICNNCGKELIEGTPFCTNCGMKVSGNRTKPNPIQKTGNIKAFGNTVSSGSNRVPLFIVGGAVAVIALLLVIGNRNKSNKSETEGDYSQSQEYEAQDSFQDIEYETRGSLQDPYEEIEGSWGKSETDYSIVITDSGIDYYTDYEPYGFPLNYCSKSNIQVESEGNVYYFYDTVNDIRLKYDPSDPKWLSIYIYMQSNGKWEVGNSFYNFD